MRMRWKSCFHYIIVAILVESQQPAEVYHPLVSFIILFCSTYHVSTCKCKMPHTTYTHISWSICIYIHTYIHTYLPTYLPTYVRTYVCMYVCMYIIHTYHVLTRHPVFPWLISRWPAICVCLHCHRMRCRGPIRKAVRSSVLQGLKTIVKSQVYSGDTLEI